MNLLVKFLLLVGIFSVGSYGTYQSLNYGLNKGSANEKRDVSSGSEEGATIGTSEVTLETTTADNIGESRSADAGALNHGSDGNEAKSLEVISRASSVPTAVTPPEVQRGTNSQDIGKPATESNPEITKNVNSGTTKNVVIATSDSPASSKELETGNGSDTLPQDQKVVEGTENQVNDVVSGEEKATIGSDESRKVEENKRSTESENVSAPGTTNLPNTTLDSVKIEQSQEQNGDVAQEGTD